MPVLIKISGNSEALEQIAIDAPGPVNLPYVDFISWAKGLVSEVAKGLDPLKIEAAAESAFKMAGYADPRALIATTHHFKRFTKETTVDMREMGFLLPPHVTLPHLTPDQRRAAFMQMVADLDVHRFGVNDMEMRDKHPNRKTPFSLQSFLPVDQAELIPTWYGRFDPHRRMAKKWSAKDGGLDHAKVSLDAEGNLQVTGVLLTGGQVAAPFHLEAMTIAQKYSVNLEMTSWGNVRTWRADGVFTARKNVMERFVVATASHEGVQNTEQLILLMQGNRHEKVATVLEAINYRCLHPTGMEMLAKNSPDVWAQNVDALSPTDRAKLALIEKVKSGVPAAVVTSNAPSSGM